MFGIKVKPKSNTIKPKKSTPMSAEAKRRQQTAIVDYYVKKRKEENKRK